MSVDDSIFRSGGQMWTYGSKRVVRKARWASEKPWYTTNCPYGNRSFTTWAEAYDWASARITVMNAA